MPQEVLEGGDNNMTKRLPNQRFNNPTNYPTYLGTTYFPTPSWPTYSPTIVKDASAVAREPKKKRNQKRNKQQDQLNATATTPSSGLILTTSPSTRPTVTPSTRPTVTPSTRPTAPPSKRPSISPTVTAKTKMASEVTSTPSPTNKSASESEIQQKIEEVRIGELPTRAPTSNARSPDSSPRWSGPSRGQPFSRSHTLDPTVLKESIPTQGSTDTSERGYTSERGHTSIRGQPYSKRQTPDPTVLEVSISTQGKVDTSEPTPSQDGQSEVAEEDDQNKSKTKTPSHESSESKVSFGTTTGENEDKDHDQTAKLNLSFEVKEVPSPSPVKADSTSKLNYKIYGQGKDDDKKTPVPAMSPITEDPTYFIYPTFTPTEDVEGVTRFPWPTYMPTTGNGLSFDTRNRVDDYPISSSPSSLGVDGESASIYDKRICPGYPFGFDPLIPKQEEEVFFAYGIQTNVEAGDSIESSVERIQLWILEDVASHLLLCPNDGSSISGRLLKDEKGFEQPVSRVYYMENTAVAILSKCTPTFSNATECAIVQSAIYLTASIGHREEARFDTLSVINDRLGRGSYEQSAILHVSYLGPDMKNLNVIGSKNSDSIKNSSDSSQPITFYIAIGVVSLAVCALATFLIMVVRVRKERKRASSALPNSPGYRRAPMAVDDMYFFHSPSSKNSSMYFQDSSRTQQ